VSDFGFSADGVLAANLPICGMAGDQQAAVLGQACFDPGMIKSTYGTGCFVLANTGTQAVTSQNRLLTTIAYRLDGQTIYGLEGSIFMAGAIVQWLRDALCLIEKASDTAALAAAADPTSNIVLVPAFTGLGAPHWKPDARAALFNMTRDTGRAEIVRAALEAVSLQTDDLLRAINDDMAHAGLSVPPRLRVDGGMVANDWFVQNLADLCACPIDRPEVIETTAAGAAMLAMVKLGWYDSPAEFAASWQLNASFEPSMPENQRAHKQRVWQGALEPILRGAEPSGN
jgi:glycerol kinase